MSGEAIRFDNVTKSYGALRALNGVSLGIARGEMFGLIGPDGAGKTTAIRLACGLLRPDEGDIFVLDRSPTREHRAITGAVGYLSQRFSLYGVARYREERDRLLAITQLTPFRKRRADKLSGGMKQKLALACTLIHQPEVLLLDEPTTGVDPVSRREFWKLLSEFLSQGLTIVMATPYLDEAERCARVALLHNGRLMAIDAPGALQASLRGTLFEVLVDAPRPPVDLLAAIPGVMDVQVFGDRAHVRFAETTIAAAADAVQLSISRAGLRAVSIRPVPASLEDVFIDLITAADTRSREIDRT
jgi:ABC-2 type transport system ATP-binding protein